MKFSSTQYEYSKSVDMMGIGEGLVATVALKESAGKTSSDWWFSGLNDRGELLVLARFMFGLGYGGRYLPDALIENLYEGVLRGPLMELSKLGGFTSIASGASSATKLSLCHVHLDGHKLLGNIGEDLPIREDVARQFQLIKSFGYSNAQKLISEKTGLPRSTVDRRLFLARESGLVPKMTRLDESNHSKQEES